MDVAEHLRTIWRRRLQLVGAALIIAALVYVVTGAASKVYESEAVLRVLPATSASSSQQGDTAIFLGRTYAKLATTTPVLDDAAKRSGLTIDGGDADGRLTVTADDTVGFITVRATGPSPTAANRLADGEATALISAITTQEDAKRNDLLQPLQTEIASVKAELAKATAGSPTESALLAQLQGLNNEFGAATASAKDRIELVQQADVRPGAIAPTPTRNAILAFLIALVLNAELSVLLASLGDRLQVDDGEEVTKLTGLPVLARIPEEDGIASLEAFRTLRTNLMFLDGSVQLRSLAVVGPEPESGKSFVAAGLASVAASLGLPVVLIDADLRHPVQHERLMVRARPGLGDLLRRTAGLDQVLHKNNDQPQLTVIPGGAPVDDPSGLLAGNMAPVLADLSWADLVIIDTPAARLYAEGPAVAAQCDATLVVLSAETARRRAVREFVADLRRVGARPVGVVLNRVDVDVEALERYIRADRTSPARRTQRSRANR